MVMSPVYRLQDEEEQYCKWHSCRVNIGYIIYLYIVQTFYFNDITMALCSVRPKGHSVLSCQKGTVVCHANREL